MGSLLYVFPVLYNKKIGEKMLKSIYKITNKINNKIYIGQSNNPIRRFSEHKYNNSNSVIHRAINKYGVNNFTFEIIEEDIPNYNEREKYWIKFYDCKCPNGYNETDGGEEPPVFSGDKCHFSEHSYEDILKIKDLLKNSNISISQIADMFNYSDNSGINKINTGVTWYDETEEYPLRPMFNCKTIREKRIIRVQQLLLETDLTQKEIGKICGVGRTAVTAINNGSNGFREEISYPIRKGRHYNKNL